MSHLRLSYVLHMNAAHHAYVVCYSVSQCVAVCCSVLQFVIVCCSDLQCVAVYYRVFCSHVSHMNAHNAYAWVMSRIWMNNVTIMHETNIMHVLQHTTIHCSILQRSVSHCNTPPYIATYCNRLRETNAKQSNALQRTPQWMSDSMRTQLGTVSHCNTYQHTLQHTAIHYNTLHHQDERLHSDATQHCTSLQHTL